MIGTKIPILICLSFSSLYASLITVNLSGVTSGGDYTVTQNAYSGAYSGFPVDYYSNPTTTVFGAGTAWTAQFTFDTAQMPASILSSISGLNGADPITTFLTDSDVLQWATATFTIGGFTFTTGADPLDVPPTAGVDQFAAVFTPVSYGSRVAYGGTSFSAQGFHGYSSVQSSYSFLDQTVAPGNPSALDYGRYGALSFHVYQNDIAGPLFTGSGVPDNFSFVDTDVPFPGTAWGFGFAGFGSYTNRYSTVDGALYVDASYLSAAGADLVVTSAVTSGYTPAADPGSDASAVPEPATMALGAIGAGLIALGRLRR
jgi:hypothetical protein